MRQRMTHVPSGKSDTQYAFTVTLKGRRSVRRTIALRGDQTLDDLHEAIFHAFDRFDPHLYSFYIPKAPTRRSRPGPTPKEYTAPQGYEGPGPFGSSRQFNAAETRLDALGLKTGRTFEHLFDFGDTWWHEVTVESMEPAEGKGGYPRILDSRGVAPPQYPEGDDD
jgi:hypothetical protein